MDVVAAELGRAGFSNFYLSVALAGASDKDVIRLMCYSDIGLLANCLDDPSNRWSCFTLYDGFNFVWSYRTSSI